ncbi:MAG: hypothetical protein PUP93_08510 [Rhizonema sp. NSF051]|nr:hypothetical protein [Rhizonema sp. NSF051]
MNFFDHQLEQLHLHVDGSGRLNWKEITNKLSDWHFEFKTAEIRDWSAGPQRSIKPDIYGRHTPERQGVEDFSFLITAKLNAGGVSYIDKIPELLKLLSAYPGSVVEIEKEVGFINTKGALSFIDFTDLTANLISLPNFVFEQNLLEVHHQIDIPNETGDTETKPLDFKLLLELSREAEMEVGGWFLFKRNDRWSYRSNSFLKLETPEHYNEFLRQYKSFHKLLRHVAPSAYHRMLVEQVLGIWKADDIDSSTTNYPDQYRRSLTRQDLSRWEKEFDNLEEFWVVAPNFLGDRFDEFFEAMRYNLWERNPPTKYFYFLRSFTDLQRLRQLVDQLSRKIGRDVKEINAVVFWNEKTTGDLPPRIECSFIANPQDSKSRAGYTLDGENNGVEMGIYQLQEHVDKLRPLIKHHVQSICVKVSRYTEISTDNFFVMRTALIDYPKKKEKLVHDYDMIIAEEVSKTNGDVVNTAGLAGYIALFYNPSSAAMCAEAIQRELNKDFNIKNIEARHIIALEHGSVSRVWRSHGIDYIGNVIQAVESLAKRAMTTNRGCTVLMSERFRLQWLLDVDINDFSKKINFAKLQNQDGTPVWELIVLR